MASEKDRERAESWSYQNGGFCGDDLAEQFAAVRAEERTHLLASLRHEIEQHPGCDGCEIGLAEITKAVQKALAGTVSEPREMAGPGWSGRMGGFCPVQGEGDVDGLRWYFRARGESWSFETSKAGEDICDPAWDTIFYTEADYGDAPFDASWMPYPDAWERVVLAIAELRASRPRDGEAP